MTMRIKIFITNGSFKTTKRNFGKAMRKMGFKLTMLAKSVGKSYTVCSREIRNRGQQFYKFYTMNGYKTWMVSQT